MNELKPEDVMRALECHSGDGDCLVCPYFTNVYDESCIKNLLRDALALLREKDALLEKWDADFKTYESMLNSKDAEIERFKSYIDHFKMVMKLRRR